MPCIDLHHAKLLVGDAHYVNMAPGWQIGLGSLYVYLGVFAAAAMPHIDTELKHLKTICQHFLSECSILFPVVLRLACGGAIGFREGRLQVPVS